MAQRQASLRVGLLLAASLAMVVGIVLALTGNRLADGRAYESYFRESVQGLDVGAPVKFRGVTLGRITNIGLVSAKYGATADEQVMDPQYRLIVVRYKIDPKKIGRLPATADAVKSGLRAHLASQGLTGVMYLELDFVDPANYPTMSVPWQPQDEYIPSIPSTIAQVQDTITNIARKLDAIDFQSLFGHVDGLIASLQAELQPGGHANSAIIDAQATIAALRRQIEGADLPGLSAQFKATGASLQALADGQKTRQSVAAARDALEKLPPLIATLDRTARDTDRSLADLTAELLPVLKSARIAMENLRDASETLRRDPGSALWQGAPPREGSRK